VDINICYKEHWEICVTPGPYESQGYSWDFHHTGPSLLWPGFLIGLRNVPSLASKASKSFSTKDFPRPFSYPWNEEASNTQLKCCLQAISPFSGPFAFALRYTCNLEGITGTVMESDTDSVENALMGLSDGVDRYLDTYGYDSNSHLHIIYAWWKKSRHRGLCYLYVP
jgi:hypothetical protein